MLETTVGGIHLKCCIYNASGPRTGSIEALAKIAESSSGAVLSKSATLVQQQGNPMPRFVNNISLGAQLCNGSMNAEGLPNYGIDYYISQDAIAMTNKFDKPYIVSISGLNLADNLQMIRMISAKEAVSSIEVNLACPNLPGKPVIAYDFDQMDVCLSEISHLLKELNCKKPVGIKLAPYFDIPHFERAVAIIVKYDIVKYIVTINTIGNALFVDYQKECSITAPKGGLGGLGGGFVKYTALANVNLLYKLLCSSNKSNDIDIVAVGGVASGVDAFELILCGARAVQVGTCHWIEGAGCFQRIAMELSQIMTSKGYKSIDDFSGKLKPYDSSLTAVKSSGSSTGSSGNDRLKVTVRKLKFCVLCMAGYILTVCGTYYSYGHDAYDQRLVTLVHAIGTTVVVVMLIEVFDLLAVRHHR